MKNFSIKTIWQKMIASFITVTLLLEIVSPVKSQADFELPSINDVFLGMAEMLAGLFDMGMGALNNQILGTEGFGTAMISSEALGEGNGSWFNDLTYTYRDENGNEQTGTVTVAEGNVNSSSSDNGEDTDDSGDNEGETDDSSDIVVGKDASGKNIVVYVKSGTMVEGAPLANSENWEVPNLIYCPENIFGNNISMLDVNFLNPNNFSSVVQEGGTNNRGVESAKEHSISIASELKSIIAGWYKAFRNIAIVVLLSILIYLGIRILLSSSAGDKAKYKGIMQDWIMAVVILVSMHLIMSFIIMIVNVINSLFVSFNNNIFVSYDGELFKSNFTGVIRFLAQSTDVSTAWVYTILYIILVVYTFGFTLQYLKRVLYIAFYTMISPIVAITYPLDKLGDGQSQAFNKWVKEYIMTMALQPIHLIIYTMIVSSSLTLSVKSPIFAIVAIGFLIPAEQYIKSLFGVESKADKGFIATAATTAIAMSALNSLKKPIKTHSNKNGNKASGDTEEKPTPIRQSKTHALDSFKSGNDNNGENYGNYGNEEKEASIRQNGFNPDVNGENDDEQAQQNGQNGQNEQGQQGGGSNTNSNIGNGNIGNENIGNENIGNGNIGNGNIGRNGNIGYDTDEDENSTIRQLQFPLITENDEDEEPFGIADSSNDEGTGDNEEPHSRTADLLRSTKLGQDLAIKKAVRDLKKQEKADEKAQKASEEARKASEKEASKRRLKNINSAKKRQRQEERDRKLAKKHPGLANARRFSRNLAGAVAGDIKAGIDRRNSPENVKKRRIRKAVDKQYREQRWKAFGLPGSPTLGSLARGVGNVAKAGVKGAGFVAKTGLRGAGAVMGAGTGLAIGVASGKGLEGAANGVIAGAASGAALGNNVYNVGENVVTGGVNLAEKAVNAERKQRKAMKDIAYDREIARLEATEGPGAANEYAREHINKARKKEFDKILDQYEIKTGARLTDVSAEKKEELYKSIYDYKNHGVDDDSKIVQGLRMEYDDKYKDLRETVGLENSEKKHEQMVDIMSFTNAFSQDSFDGDKKEKYLDHRMKDIISDKNERARAKQMLAAANDVNNWQQYGQSADERQSQQESNGKTSNIRRRRKTTKESTKESTIRQ